jgi:hypothetical protein
LLALIARASRSLFGRWLAPPGPKRSLVSSDNAPSPQSGDLAGVQTEVASQNFVGVFTEHRWRARSDGPLPVDHDRACDAGKVTELLMLEFDLHSPVPDMRIGKYVGDLVDRPCRDTGRVQPLDPCVGAGYGEQRDEFALKRRLVSGAGAIGGEAGIFCKIRD